MFTNKDTKFFKEDEAIGLNESLLMMLDCAREEAGIPFHITSGLRSEEKNKIVGGVENSAHLRGLAVDILCLDDTQEFFIKKGAFYAGFKRILKGNNHIHLDIDETKPQNICGLEKNYILK